MTINLKNKGFSEVWIEVVIIAILIGGVFVWQYIADSVIERDVVTEKPDICVDNDNFCPWECNYWRLDNDCGLPQIHNFIASNNPKDFKGDVIIHYTDTEWRNYQPLIDQVDSIILNIDDDYEKAVAIANWVANSRPYTDLALHPERQKMSVIEIFYVEHGICIDAAILTTAMFRTAGLPARVIISDIHAYTEVFVNNKWIAFDSTFGFPNGDREVIAIYPPITPISFVYEFLENTKGIARFKIIPRSVLTPNWGFVYIPVTSRYIFVPKKTGIEYSLTFNKEKYIHFVEIGWNIRADNLLCISFYHCEIVDSTNYSQYIYRNVRNMTGYGYGDITDESFSMGQRGSINGFIKIILPEGRYRINFSIFQLIDDAHSGNAYKYFEVKPNTRTIIFPDSLQKDSEITDEIFDLIIKALNSSIESVDIEAR